VTSLDAPGIVGIVLQPTNGDIYVGGLDVTTSTGALVVSGQMLRITSNHPNKWGMVASSGTVNVRCTLLKVG
jgi:ABC-type sugar transport system substrate-binding protein